jgi:drug/metabolite transporter (DMT)-like permease
MTTTAAPVLRRHTSPVGIAAVVAGAACLSLGSTLVKKAGMPGVVVAFWRLFFGMLIWWCLMLATRTRPLWSRMKRAIPAGIVFGLDLAFFFSAVTRMRVASAEFIGALAPFAVLPLAAIFLKERVRAAAIACGVLAVGGVALIVLTAPSSGQNTTIGTLLAFGAVLSWAVYLLLTKKVRATLSTVEFMTVTATVACITVGPLALASPRFVPERPAQWGWVLLLAVVTGTVAHGLVVWSQRLVPVSTISTLGLSQPALAAGWAWLILGESLLGSQLVGMAVVLVALFLFVHVQQGRP